MSTRNRSVLDDEFFAEWVEKASSAGIDPEEFLAKAMKKDRAGVVKLLAKVQHKLSEERCEEMKSNQFKFFCAFAQARLDMLDQAEPASSQPKQKRRASSQTPASPDAAPAPADVSAGWPLLNHSISWAEFDFGG